MEAFGLYYLPRLDSSLEGKSRQLATQFAVAYVQATTLVPVGFKNFHPEK